MQLGKSGLGAGAKPENGRAAAEEARERIADELRDAHMVFITAGMGGGTGTGAAPIVAQVAKEMGILTVGVVSKPFGFEGSRKMRTAEDGLDSLAAHVDSLIVVLNEKLEEVMGEDAEMDACFKCADDVPAQRRGRHRRDHQGRRPDQRRLRGREDGDEASRARQMMGTAMAAGIDRARLAAEQAVTEPAARRRRPVGRSWRAGQHHGRAAR